MSNYQAQTTTIATDLDCAVLDQDTSRRSNQQQKKARLKSKMQVQGHRGGFEPENTMKSFQMAIDHGIQAIEIDIWLTNDGVPVILHGGDNGELNHHFTFDDTHYIFEKSFEELMKFDMGDGEKIPTLDNLLKFCRDRLFINIELKVPRLPHVKSAYKYQDCAREVFRLIENNGMSDQVLISSFDRCILSEIENLNHKQIQQNQFAHAIETIYLMNYHQEELPESSVYTQLGSGINVSSLKITQEVVDLCHAHGQKVGVWISKKADTEDEEMYMRLMSMGVDFICSDYPHKVLEAQIHFESRKQFALQSIEIQEIASSEEEHDELNCSLVSQHSDQFRAEQEIEIEDYNMDSDKTFFKPNFDSCYSSNASTIESDYSQQPRQYKEGNIISFKDLQMIRRNFFEPDIKF